MLPYWTAPDLTKEPYIDINLDIKHYIYGVSMTAIGVSQFVQSYKLYTSEDCVIYSFTDVSVYMHFLSLDTVPNKYGSFPECVPKCTNLYKSNIL